MFGHNEGLTSNGFNGLRPPPSATPPLLPGSKSKLDDL